MGYYTTIEISLLIKKDTDFKELQKKIKAAKDKELRAFPDIKIEGRYIELDDYYRKLSEEDIMDFSKFFAKYVEAGDIAIRDDSGMYNWRILFDGKGGFKKQFATINWIDADF